MRSAARVPEHRVKVGAGGTARWVVRDGAVRFVIPPLAVSEHEQKLTA